MKIIGLSGPSGSGKGMVSKLFEEYNIPSIDCDKVYHSLLVPPSKCLDEIRERFTDIVFSDDGTLNRPKLAEIVFKNDEQSRINKNHLNNITHKYVLDKCREWLDVQKKSNKIAAIVDAPLLFESGFDKECDYTISVLAEPTTRLKRVMKRDNISVEQAERRIDAQPKDDYFISNSTYIIHNNGDLTNLKNQIAFIYEKIRGNQI